MPIHLLAIAINPGPPPEASPSIWGWMVMCLLYFWVGYRMGRGSPARADRQLDREP